MTEGELGKVYSDGEVIFREGDIGEVMYVIQSGNIKITKHTDSGEITIATLEKGEIFGEMAIFDRLPRSAAAVASGETRILSIDKKKLFTTISRDPTLVFKILESMSRRIRTLDRELTKLKKDHADVLHICIDVDETCNLVLNEAKNIISSDNGSVMLLDDATKTLTIKAAFGVESEQKMRLPEGEGIAGDVVRTGRAELVNNVTMDSRFIPGSVKIRSMLCVPLKCNDNTFGVINMSNGSEKIFTVDDLKLLHSLAIYASITLQNAKNFAHLKNATDEILRHATMLDVL
jgi:CRP-like cAMP-binding protein